MDISELLQNLTVHKTKYSKPLLKWVGGMY